jgi:hypothetical protein
MYFFKIDSLQRAKEIKFEAIGRSLGHLLALHGHLHLTKVVISVLGLNRNHMSLNLNAID